MGRRAAFGYQVRAQLIPGSKAETEVFFSANLEHARSEVARINAQQAAAGRPLFPMRIRNTRNGLDMPLEVK